MTSRPSPFRKPKAAQLGRRKVTGHEARRRKRTHKVAQKEASRQVCDFIAFLAHELRNPLTTIRGYVQTIQADHDHTLDEETRQEFYEAIEADSDRMLDLINEVLDTSRLDAGRPLSLAVKVVQIVPLLERLLRRHRFYKYCTGRHTLTLNIAPDLPDTLAADEEKLTQIFSNLLGNALKYSPAGGVVTIAARPDGIGGMLISVQDEGVGLTVEQCARLFRPFERVERESIKSIPGTGLGLYLVKHLVELHGGDIEVCSSAGKGSVFTVHLPLRPNSSLN